MIEKAMAIVSSCMSRLSSTSGTSSPSTRITGWEPTLIWRSDARRSAAIFSRSLMCTGSPRKQVFYANPAYNRPPMTLARHDDLALHYVLSVPSGKPDHAEMPLVIVMHGRGADANDLADLAPMIDGGYRFV